MTKRKTTGTFDYNGDELRQHDHVLFPLELGRLAEGIVADDLDQTPRTYITIQSTKTTDIVLVKPDQVLKVPHD